MMYSFSSSSSVIVGLSITRLPRTLFPWSTRSGRSSGVITPEDLPERVLQGNKVRGSLVIDNPTMTLDELEKEYIMKVLHHTSGQKKRASETAGSNPTTRSRQLLSYGLV